MKKIVQILLLAFSMLGIAQSSMQYNGETINKLDENGNKIGVWKLYNNYNDISRLIRIDFDNDGKISYYKNSDLIATCTKKNNIEIYKDSEIIKAKYFYRPHNSQTLVSENGKELESSIIKYYSAVAETHPIFYPNTNAFYEFIKTNSKKINQSGKAKVKFTIDVNGFIKNIEIMETTNPAINDEVKRIISIVPRWQPGFQGGNFVNVTYAITISVN